MLSAGGLWPCAGFHMSQRATLRKLLLPVLFVLWSVGEGMAGVVSDV
jgi:hypothetical protein